MHFSRLRPLFPYMKRYWKSYLIGSAAVLCTNAIWVQSPRIMGRIADDLNQGVTHGKLLTWCSLLVVIALASSTGFTFALFFATGIVSIGPVLAQLTIGALATAAGSLLAFGAAWLLRVGRFTVRLSRP